MVITNGRRNSPFTRGRAKRAHKEKEVVVDGGQELYAPRRAARHVKASYPTLIKWANLNETGDKNGCPWLGGKAIGARPLPTAYGRIINYFLKDDLDLVLKAKANREEVPTYDGHVHVIAAAKDLGVSARTLRRAYSAYKKHLAMQGQGNKPVAEDKPARSTDGRALPRSYVPKMFVEWLKQRRALSPPADEISIAEAAGILGISPAGIHSLIGRGLLTATKGRIACKGGYARKGMVLSKANVDAHRDAQQAKYGEVAEKKRKEKAKEILQEILADGERHLRSKVIAKAVADGVRYTLVCWAKKQLKVRSEREALKGGGSGLGPAYWILPAPAATPMNQRCADQANGQGPANSHATPRRPKRGPDPDPITEAMSELCYREYVTNRLSRKEAWKIVKTHFPNNAPSNPDNVKVYARRYAARHSLPGR